MFHGFSHFFQTWIGNGQPKEEPERPFRVLIPVSGGPHAPAALGILPGLAKAGNEVVYLHVRRPGSPRNAVLEEALFSVTGVAAVGREVVAEDPRAAIVAASHDHDLLVLGASGNGRPVSDPRLLDIARRSECPTIVVRSGLTPRRTDRDGPRALVIAEASPEGMLGYERALRWAKSGSVAQDVLLIPATEEARDRDPERRKLDLRRFSSEHMRFVNRALDGGEILEEIESRPRDLVVVACDPTDLLEGDARFDVVVEHAECPVVCVLASQTGPRTRRRRIAVTV